MHKNFVRYALRQRPASALLDTEDGQRKLRPRKSKDTKAVEVATSTVNQETVFAIPELLDLITQHMNRYDLQVVIRVCRAWNAFWVPYLYSALLLNNYKRTRKYPSLWTYGEHIKNLHLTTIKWNNILHILDFTTNIQSISLRFSPLTFAQFQEFITLVPRVRFLHLHFSQANFHPWDRPLVAIANLPNLEALSWEECGAQTRIDDLLFLLKSCNNLNALDILNNRIIEELQDAEEIAPDLVRVDDDGWENTALQSLHWQYVTLGPRLTFQDESAHPHPCVRRLFKHIPNLNTVKISSIIPISALDWAYILEGRSNMQSIDIQAPPFNRFDRTYAPIEGSAVLNTIARSCSNLKILELKSIVQTTDQAFEQVMRVSHGLRRVCATNTQFGDLALMELARPPSLTGSRSSIYTLVDLELSGCVQITWHSAALVLENCGKLRTLNLAGTKAGTIDLFKGDKPWPCAKNLEKLQIDIQPVDFKPRSQDVGSWLTAALPAIPHTPYSSEENHLIRDRLRSLTALVGLGLKGQAMHFEIFDDISFAPGLRKVILCIPSDGDFYGYQEVRHGAITLGKTIFPDWIVWANTSFLYSRLDIVLTANKDRDYYDF
ncbi:hypothetical protein EDD21DRAFT_361977 [Dissophora ornata]|nr:hypothetical protein BGZ58_006281 [Dissophora ornata]KAI8606087.1 hypothetical protein EDD21DRAFT_361977 [Dissophora ornata]